MLKNPPAPKIVPLIHAVPSPRAAFKDPYRDPRYRSVRKGRLIGLALAVTLEVGVAWSGNRTRYVRPPVVKSDDILVQIEMPKLEPDPVDDVIDQTNQQTTQNELAPPMQTDVPQLVTPESFVQQIEPPPPDFSELAKNVVKIPDNRSSFGKITVLDISQLDQIPVPKYRVRPVYPSEMIREGMSGQVVVDFIVDTSGGVRNAVAYSSTHHEFEESAVTAVEKWKFSPGRKNSHAVYTHMQVPIIFNLHKEMEEQ